MMLLFAFSSLLAVASCTDINTLILCNQGLPKPVSSVKLLEEYAHTEKGFGIIKILNDLPINDDKLPKFLNYKGHDNDECIDLALVFQKLQRENKVKIFNYDIDQESLEGLYFFEGETTGHGMVEVFETLVMPGKTDVEVLAAAEASTKSREIATENVNASGNAAGSASGRSGTTQTAPTTVATTTAAVTVPGVQVQSVATGTERQQNVSENAEPIAPIVLGDQNTKILMIMTKCDLKMVIPEEKLSGSRNMRENQGSGFTPAIAFTSLLPFLLMMS